MQRVSSSGQICNQMKWGHQVANVAKFDLICFLVRFVIGHHHRGFWPTEGWALAKHVTKVVEEKLGWMQYPCGIERDYMRENHTFLSALFCGAYNSH